MTTETKPTLPGVRSRSSRAALFLAAGFMVVVAFQVALAFGSPFGAAAQGGMNPGKLPDDLRIVSGVSAILWLFATVIVLARGGWNLAHLPNAVARVGTWLIVALLGVGAFMNFASSSPWERFGWGPFTFGMFIVSVVLATSASVEQPGTQSRPS